MCKEMEQQKIKTKLQFNDVFGEERTEKFKHQVLDPQNLRQEVETARLSERVFQDVRAQMRGEAPPVQVQTIQQARPQTEVPQAAPQEKSWKERRAEKKQQEKALKAGRKLTKHADVLTADIAARHQEWEKAPAFRDIPDRQQVDAAALREELRQRNDALNTYTDTTAPEYHKALFERNAAAEKLRLYAQNQQAKKAKLKEHLGVFRRTDITSDLFTDENFPSNCRFLREVVERGQWTARLAEDQELMAELKEEDLVLYSTVLHWQKTAPLVKNMFEMANAAHGLDIHGKPIPETKLARSVTLNGEQRDVPNVVQFTRENYQAQLEHFRTKMTAQKQTHWETLSNGLQGEFEEELNKQKINALMSGTEEERGWIESPSLAYGTGEAYEAIQEIKSLIEQSNEFYLANKNIADKMYSDVIRRYEVLGELTAQSNAWSELQFKYQTYQNQPSSDGHKLWQEANKQLDRLSKDSIAVQDNLTSIQNALTRLLKGQQTDILEAAVLETYGYHAAADMEIMAAPLRELASARARREKWQNEALGKLLGTEKQPGPFRPADPNSQYVTRAVTLFEQGDDAYNLELLETLQPFEKELNRKRPVQTEGMSKERFEELKQEDTEHRREYYEKIRQIVEPQVARIMTWEMDRYLQMSDEELLGAQKELDDLFGANMFTSDLMKLKHPKMDSWQMKDDILGDQLEEFSHRLSILRALTDRSRGLVLKALGQLGPLSDECFGVELTYGKLGDGSQQARREFAQKQIDLGNRQLQAEQKKWADRRDIHSEAFQQACMEKYQKKGVSRNIPDPDSPLDAIRTKYERHYWGLQPDATQEEKDVYQRLKMEKYRIACWDMEDARAYAREHGVDPDAIREKDLIDSMGEPIFRVFTSYIQTPGAQIQSPEEFEQMLRDLSAGAQLQRGVSSDEEIFAAREQNLRGCLQFKESLRVSYEYLGRKYGFGLESLTPLEIYDHWEEILRDFGNVQVDANFINRIPDIIDMENEEDEALFHQVTYLSILSRAVQNMLLLIGTGLPADGVITDIRSSATGEFAGPHREALKEMGAAAGMSETVRWEQKPGARRLLPAEDPEAKEKRWQKFQQREETRRHNESLEVSVAMFQEAEAEYAEREKFEQDFAEMETPEELELILARDRMNEKLQKLNFDTAPERTANMTMKRKFWTGKMGQSDANTSITLRKDLLEKFGEEFGDETHYGEDYHGEFTNATGTVILKGIFVQRMTSELVGALGGAHTTEELAEMYRKLFSGGRYRQLRAKKELIPEEQTELDAYTPEKLAELDASFDEGVAQLKRLQLEHLRRVRDKYGRYPSQLHPEDFLERVGLDYFDEMASVQDVAQALVGKYYDPNNPDDRELNDLVDYYRESYGVILTYMMQTDWDYSKDEFSPNIDDFNDIPAFSTLSRREFIAADGPGFTEEEQAAYEQQLRVRKPNRLIARFKPQA